MWGALGAHVADRSPGARAQVDRPRGVWVLVAEFCALGLVSHATRGWFPGGVRVVSTIGLRRRSARLSWLGRERGFHGCSVHGSIICAII